MHQNPHPMVGKTVKIKPNVTHPQVPNFGGSDFRLEDWHDRIAGKSWMHRDGNPACIVYAIRTGMSGNVPTDNEVVYGKIGAFGHLIHASELDLQPEANACVGPRG